MSRRGGGKNQQHFEEEEEEEEEEVPVEEQQEDEEEDDSADQDSSPEHSESSSEDEKDRRKRAVAAAAQSKKTPQNIEMTSAARQKPSAVSFSSQKQSTRQKRKTAFGDDDSEDNSEEEDNSRNKRSTASTNEGGLHKRKGGNNSNSDESDEEREKEEVNEYSSDNSSDFSDNEHSYDYLNPDKVRRPKREKFDSSETCQKWVGFYVIVLFMWGVFYLMQRTGMGSSRNQKPREGKEVTLEPSNIYPFDIEFHHNEYRAVHDTQTRIKDVLCKNSAKSFYSFFVESSTSFNTHLDLTCTHCNSIVLTKDDENKTPTSLDQELSHFRCTEQINAQAIPFARAFKDGQCEECSDECHRCLPFSHFCYSCFKGTNLENGRCVETCQENESSVEHFCVDNKQKLKNLNVTVLAGEDHNLFLFHRPNIKMVSVGIPLPETMGKFSEQQQQQQQLNPSELEEEEKKKEKQKKYPLIVVLNDWRHSQEEIFKTSAIGRYLDKAMILSVPMVNSMMSANTLHKWLLGEIKSLIQPTYEPAIAAYMLVGFGAAGEIVNEISLNQQDDSVYWQARFMTTSAISEKSLMTVVHQNQNQFDESIKSRDTYFKDRSFCRLESRQKQIRSVSAGNQTAWANNPQGLLDYYIKNTFDEVLQHFDNNKVSLNGF